MNATVIFLFILLLINFLFLKKIINLKKDVKNMDRKRELNLFKFTNDIHKIMPSFSNEQNEAYYLISYPEIKHQHGVVKGLLNTNAVWASDMKRWHENWRAIKEGIITIPETRVTYDSLEADEYLRIARSTIRSYLDKVHEPTVDFYTQNVIVAFRLKRKFPDDDLYLPPKFYFVIIDINSKSVLLASIW